MGHSSECHSLEEVKEQILKLRDDNVITGDDTAITARWVGYVAGRLGFTPVLAFTGEDALNCLAQHHFVAVISDVEMPGMNGFELLQNIREFYPEMPVILMSASNGHVCKEWPRFCSTNCRKPGSSSARVSSRGASRVFESGCGLT